MKVSPFSTTVIDGIRKACTGARRTLIAALDPMVRPRYVEIWQATKRDRDDDY